jgi:hypothetical protein
MQITVTSPDDPAARIEARGFSPQGFVEGLIERASHVALLSPGRMGQRDMQRFFREISAHSDNIPQLPDEAFTRESFYRDHD